MEIWLVPLAIVGVAALTAIYKFAEWRGAVDADRKNFGSFIKEIRDDIKEILGRIPPTPVAGNSPRTLTEFGHEISDHFGAEDWANQLIPKLAKDIRGKEPFEIDRFCQNYVQNKISDEEMVRIYESADEMAIDKDGVLEVLAVVLRDKLLPLA